MEVAIIVILLVGLFLLRNMIKSDGEKYGRNICPNCGSKMEINMFSRYYCSKCGWRQGHGYF